MSFQRTAADFDTLNPVDTPYNLATHGLPRDPTKCISDPYNSTPRVVVRDGCHYFEPVLEASRAPADGNLITAQDEHEPGTASYSAVQQLRKSVSAAETNVNKQSSENSQEFGAVQTTDTSSSATNQQKRTKKDTGNVVIAVGTNLQSRHSRHSRVQSGAKSQKAKVSTSGGQSQAT